MKPVYLIFGVISGIVLLMVALPVLQYIAFPYHSNKLCENKWTASLEPSREDHEELKADGTDCCFLKDWESESFSLRGATTAEEWCTILVTSCKESPECSTGSVTLEDCSKEPTPQKSYFLFDCKESTKTCDTSECVMSCNGGCT